MSYRDAIERVKIIEKALGGVLPKGVKSPPTTLLAPFGSTPPRQIEKTFTWHYFYPELNSDEWKIDENDRGVFGEKIAGELVGPVQFYIPSKMLAEYLVDLNATQAAVRGQLIPRAQ